MRILLTGDSMITRRRILNGEPGARALRSLLAEADVRFTNLEVVPNDFAGDPIPSDGGMHLGARSSVIDELGDVGFNVFSAANNHALDYGIAGLRGTIRNLTERGCTFAGIGHNLAEARRPAYVDTSNGSCALVACTSSFRPGQEAGRQRGDAPGRPGVSHVRTNTVYEVPAEALETLRTLAGRLGFDDERKALLELGVGDAADAVDDVYAFGSRFVAADRARTNRSYHPDDVADILRQLREARARADLVILSIHSHEPLTSEGLPAQPLRELCRSAAAGGANVVAVHGSHMIRGAEVHDGVPIFYGLGNFIAQNELVERFPADSYEFFGVSDRGAPSDVPFARNRNETTGFPVMRECWESVVPVCTFNGRDLKKVDVYPLSLGFGRPLFDRGKPRMCDADAGREILDRFVQLSQAFQTRMTIEGNCVSIAP